MLGGHSLASAIIPRSSEFFAREDNSRTAVWNCSTLLSFKIEGYISILAVSKASTEHMTRTVAGFPKFLCSACVALRNARLAASTKIRIATKTNTFAGKPGRKQKDPCIQETSRRLRFLQCAG